jgi:hypothetical protein
VKAASADAKEPPEYLRSIRIGGTVYVQNPDDDHEVDNWKRRRIFLDTTRQLMNCIAAGSCLRKQEFPELKGYVVADAREWHDVGIARISWEAVCPPSMRARPLRTPLGQHNALSLAVADIEALAANVAKQGRSLVLGIH